MQASLIKSLLIHHVKYFQEEEAIVTADVSSNCPTIAMATNIQANLFIIVDKYHPVNCVLYVNVSCNSIVNANFLNKI